MKIIDVKVTHVHLGRRDRPISNAILTYGDLGFSLTEVSTEEGLIGRSLGGDKSLIEGPLREMLLGEDPFYIERIWQKMYAGWRKPVAKGEVISALSSVDIALWDLLGQAVGKPVYQLLGAYRDRVPAYAAGGYYQEGKGLDELVQEMLKYVEMGYRAVKMKVGRADLKTDVERVRAVREAIGPTIDLMLDANNGWEAPEAIRFGRAVEEFSPYWLEEPVAPDDWRGGAQVAAALDVPVASGENEFTRFGFRDLIQAAAADILQPDPYVCGGITEWRKIAALASAYHLPLAPHGDPYASAHLIASAPNGLVVETYPLVNAFMDEIIRPLPLVNGELVLPQGPGLGMEFNEAARRKYSL